MSSGVAFLHSLNDFDGNSSDSFSANGLDIGYFWDKTSLM